MSAFDPQPYIAPDGSRYTLRSARPDEAQAVIDYLDAVRRESWGIMFDPADDLPELDWERDLLARRIDDPDTLSIGAWTAADAGGELVAMSGVTRDGGRVRGRHVAGLGMSVRRAHWRRGLGQAMMTELLAFAQRRPEVHVVQLGVWSFNTRAIRLYESMGFEHEGRRRWRARFEDGSYGDEQLMSRWVGPMLDGHPPKPRDNDPSLDEA